MVSLGISEKGHEKKRTMYFDYRLKGGAGAGDFVEGGGHLDNGGVRSARLSKDCLLHGNCRSHKLAPVVAYVNDKTRITAHSARWDLHVYLNCAGDQSRSLTGERNGRIHAIHRSGNGPHL